MLNELINKYYMLDTTDLGISYVKCPACSYSASFFLTADINDLQVLKDAIIADSLELLEDNSPICNNCFCEIVKDTSKMNLEIEYVKLS